jgi:hypothetical protein
MLSGVMAKRLGLCYSFLSPDPPAYRLGIVGVCYIMTGITPQQTADHPPSRYILTSEERTQDSTVCISGRAAEEGDDKAGRS